MLDKLGWRKTDKKDATLQERMLKVRSESVPQHIAIIMDGNGRWAQKRALPRVAGHHEGMKNIRTITRCANKVGIGALTLYAFSTENWKRPRKEVEFLMRLPEEFLTSFFIHSLYTTIESISLISTLVWIKASAIFLCFSSSVHFPHLQLNINFQSKSSR